MRRLDRKRQIALWLLVPYLLILLIPSALLVGAYSAGVGTMRSHIEDSHSAVLESALQNTNDTLGQLHFMALTLALQSSRLTQSVTPLSLYQSTVRNMLCVQLQYLVSLTRELDYGAIFLFGQGLAVTQSGAERQAEQIYEERLQLNGMDYVQFCQWAKEKYYPGGLVTDVKLTSKNYQSDTWVIAQTIPCDPYATPEGIVILTLNLSELQASLRAALPGDTGAIELITQDGATLLAAGGEGISAQAIQALDARSEETGTLTVQGEGYLRVRAQGKYVSGMLVQRAQNAFGTLSAYQYTWLSAILAVIVLMLVLAFFYLRKSFPAVSAILEETPISGIGNVYATMHTAFESVRAKNAQLRSDIDRKSDWIRSQFLKRLLHGEFVSSSDIIREQGIAGIDLGSPPYCVLLIKILSESQREAAISHLCAALEQAFDTCVEMTDMKKRGLAALILRAGPRDVREALERVAKTLDEAVFSPIYVSGVVEEAADLARAYGEVKTLGEQADGGSGARVILYEEAVTDVILHNFDLSRFAEQKLLNFISTHNRLETERTLEALHALWRENARDERSIKCLSYDLYRLTSRVLSMPFWDGADMGAEHVRLSVLLDGVIQDAARFEAYYEGVRHICLRACEAARQGENSADTRLREALIAYIDEHITDASLSVTGIAAHFDFSEKYISQFFREQMNVTLSGYITTKRMERACALLRDSAVSIDEAAQLSGYYNTHTFRVAFKKHTGVTPSAYRESAGT